MKVNKRAERIWLRLIQAYGSRVAESYGEAMPQPWVEAIAEVSDEQIAYGLRKIVRDTPVHPPTLGQFVAACVDMPQVATNKGPSIQEQLCAYAALQLRSRLHPMQYSLPWTHEYREWLDDTKPKHQQRCAECIGVVIPEFGDHPESRFTAANMMGDREGHARAMRYFQPGPRPNEKQMAVWNMARDVLQNKVITP